METAIRNALERSERDDPQVRARIYQSARQALKAGLQKQDITDPQIVDSQQRRLEDKIREIELEERQRAAEQKAALAAVPAGRSDGRSDGRADAQDLAGQGRFDDGHLRADIAPPVASTLSAGADETGRLGGQTRDSQGGGNAGVDPSALSGALGGMRADAASDRLVAPGDARSDKSSAAGPARRRWSRKARRDDRAAGPANSDHAPQVPGEKRKRRRRGLISRLFISVTLLSFLALASWWAFTSGLFLTDAQRDTSVPNPPPSVQEEDFSGHAGEVFNPQQGFSADWIEVYAPDGKVEVRPGQDASTEIVAMADGPALRITSRSPGETGDVAIPVSVDVLRELSGKTSTIALTLQAVGDTAVQLAVRCDFSSLGTCSRHRVMSMQERADSLFRVTFDRSLAPTQPGRLYVNSDILGGSKPILLYSIRVLPGQ
nr:hypothetical protein [Rhizobium sp. SSA_523]